MAETGSQEMNGVVLVGTDGIEQEGLISNNDEVDQSEEVQGEDLLQLALDEASGGLSTSAITYSVPNELVEAVANEAFQGTISGVENSEISFGNSVFVVSGDPSNIGGETPQVVTQTNENNSNATAVNKETSNSSNEHSVTTTFTDEGNAMTVTLVPTNEASGAPLGSSQNPIRIIQQGNQYTPVQQLTTDQLQQIMQVVQQQQVAKTASEGGGSSVLYNPQTNTKIVYRVIYPSELHKSTSSISQTSTGQQTVVQVGQFQKRQYKKKTREEEEKIDVPELTREEKEAKKKHRPRTRSGRVSKPPKHMTKDYKHIHVVDWDEDYDDSDGGYSDFKYSEDEGLDDKDGDLDYSFEAGQTTKPKNWKCGACGKSYIGKAGLSRHFRQNPMHGNADDLPQDESDSSNLSRPTHNGFSYAGSISEDSNTQDSVQGMSIRQGPGRPRKKGRGRPPIYEQTPVRKRHKLREFVKQYDNEDLMDIVLPRLAKVATLWEFLMMKVESSVTNKPNIQSVYQEFETLTEKVKELFKTCLKLSESKSDENGNSEMKLKMNNSKVADALSFEIGTYDINTEVLKSSITREELYDTPDLSKLKRPLISPASAESPAKRYKSILPNERRGNIVISTQGNIVLMGTPQKTSAGSAKVVVVNSNSLQNSSNPLVVTNKNQSNSSAAVLDCVQTQESSVVYGISPTASKSVVKTTPTVRTKIISRNSGTVVNSGGNQISPSKSILVNNKVTSVSPKTSTKPQSNVSLLKPQSTIQTTKSNVGKSSSITILPVSDSSGFNSVGVLNSVYNTSLLMNNQVSKQNEVVTNNSNELPLAVSTGNIVFDGNGVSDQGEAVMETAVTIQVKSETDENGMVIIQSLNNGNQSAVSENNLINSGISVENTNSEPHVIEPTNKVAASEVIQVVENQLESMDQVQQAESVITASNIFQTPEGIIIIQNPDGSTVQLQGSDGEPIPIETVQALLEGQYLQTADGVIMNQ